MAAAEKPKVAQIRAIVRKDAAAALAAGLEPLVWEGRAHLRTWEQGDLTLVELGDGTHPPLTPSEDGTSDPHACHRAALMAAAYKAADKAELMYLNTLCLRLEPARVNCCTAYAAEVSVLTETAAAAAAGLGTLEVANFRARLTESYRKVLVDAVERMKPETATLPNDASANTKLLVSIAQDGAKSLSAHTTEDEFRTILLAMAQLAIYRATLRAAREGTIEAADEAQKIIYHLDAHFQISEKDAPIGEPSGVSDGSVPDMVCFADAHNALLGLLTLQPSAVRAAVPASVRGQTFTWEAKSSPEESATQAMVKRLRNLKRNRNGGQKPVDLLVAPGRLLLDMITLVKWATDSVSESPRTVTVYDPGRGDEVTSYSQISGFDFNSKDTLDFALGGVRRGCLQSVTKLGSSTEYTLRNENKDFRVYLCDFDFEQRVDISACSSFMCDMINRQSRKLTQPLFSSETYRTYRIRKSSCYLRLDLEKVGATTWCKQVRLYVVNNIRAARRSQR